MVLEWGLLVWDKGCLLGVILGSLIIEIGAVLPFGRGGAHIKRITKKIAPLAGGFVLLLSAYVLPYFGNNIIYKLSH